MVRSNLKTEMCTTGSYPSAGGPPNAKGVLILLLSSSRPNVFKHLKKFSILVFKRLQFGADEYKMPLQT